MFEIQSVFQLLPKLNVCVHPMLMNIPDALNFCCIAVVYA